MSVAAYTAAYVRELAANRRLRTRVSTCLAKGEPWEQEERLVVCMVDISGYSKLSAGLAFLGKIESEIITKTVGGYLNKIIDVIELYGGDIVRFLGDALLVTFSPVGGDSLSEAVLRSLKCCLHVATCCKSVDVDMSLASSLSSTTRRESLADYSSFRSDAASTSLHLHFAITAGNMSRVIIGDPAWRLDYCVQGSGLRSLGVLLDNTGKGELGISADAVKELPDLWRDAVESMRAGAVAGHALLSTLAVASLAGMCCEMDPADMAAMPIDQVSSLFTSAHETTGHFQRRGNDRMDFVDDGDVDDFVRLFVNHSSLRRLEGSKAPQGSSSRKTSYASQSGGDVAPYQSARKGSFATQGQGAGDPAAIAEFRNVATIFVSLLFPFEKGMVQKIMFSFLRAVKESRGVFVQYSADDKGNTMLAAFGLPSFSHVNNSDQSVKCVKSFVEDIQRTLGGSLFTRYLSIAIASGEILLTKLGNDYRSEIGLLGDVVVAAARLMGIAQKKEVVVIDAETNDKIKLTHVTTDLGLVHLKGRTSDTQIFGLELDGRAGASTGQFGYKHEREVISERLGAWLRDKARTVIIIEAASGLGKSSLGNFVMDLAKDHGIPSCLTQGTEMEQWRPFSALQPILLFIFNHLPSNLSTNDGVLGQHPSSLPMTAARFVRSRSFSSVSGHRASKTGRSLALGTSCAGFGTAAGLGAAVMAFLSKAGIDMSLVPLLGMVSTDLAVGETKETENMDAQARMNHLKSMVTKIVSAFVADFNAVFVFDDAQWYDSQSLEVLMTLSRYCPKIFLQFLSRPLKMSENRILERVLTLPLTTHLVLEGFSEQDAHDMIMSKLSMLTVRVTGVDPEISSAIFAKTAGSPLFLQMIIDVVFIKVGTDLIVNDDGVLALRDGSVHLDVILSDVSAAVLFQFDRLDVGFQRLLKTASVFGQYFNLRNVLDLGNFDMDEQECIKMIKDSDVFSFLICDVPPPRDLDRIETENSTGSDGVECSFRHISILNAIYESLSFEERNAVNISVGVMIENLLNDDNREALLPSLEYHYSRTQEVEKLIKYKEELGFTLMTKFQCIEGIRILESLVLYASEADPQTLTQLVEPITSLRKAWWFARLCAGYVVVKRFPKDIEAGRTALSFLLTEPWPATEECLQRSLRSLKRWSYVNWIRTFGGRPCKNKSRRRILPEGSTHHDEQIQCEKSTLKSMSEALASNKKYTNDETLYLLLRYFNVMILHNYDDMEWCFALYKVAFYSISLGPQYYPFFVKAADAVDKGRNHPTYLFLKAAVRVFSPDFRDAAPLLLQFYEVAKARSDTPYEHISQSFYCNSSFVVGRFENIDTTSEPFYKTSLTIKDDPIFGFSMAHGLYQRALARGDVEAMAEWRGIYEERERVARAFRYGFGMKECIDAWQFALRGDFGASLGLVEECDRAIPRDDTGGNTLNCILCLIYVAVLLMDPMRSGLPLLELPEEGYRARPWTRAESKRLGDVLGRLTSLAYSLGVFRRHVPTYWCIGVFAAAEQIAAGTVRGALRIARRNIRSHRRHELDGVFGCKAFYHGIVAKYSPSRSEGQQSADIAKEIFNRMKSPLYLRWLECLPAPADSHLHLAPE